MPATEVGARDLGGLSLYWRARGFPRRAEAFANDPRRGERGRDGLRMPDIHRRDPSFNFRPVLLAGLGDWQALAEYFALYRRHGWQLREWNSPTYTARVLAAAVVGATMAPPPYRGELRQVVCDWADLLALMAVHPAPARPLRGFYGAEEIEIPARGRQSPIAIAPAGMRANRWTALQHGAADCLDLLIHPAKIEQVRARDWRRRPMMPERPADHARPVPDRPSAAIAWRGRSIRTLLTRGQRNELHRCLRGHGDAAIAVARRVAQADLTTYPGPNDTGNRRLAVRIQRRGRTVLVALDRVLSRQKGAVTCAVLSPEALQIQAVGRAGAVSTMPRVTWRPDGCSAVDPRTGAADHIPWLESPDVDLVIGRLGGRIRS